MPSQQLRTGLSEPKWCLYDANGEARFGSAELRWPDDEEVTSWFDALFGSAIDVGQGAPQGDADRRPEPRIMVIAGPPSSGKTKIALEMCYRLATGKTGGSTKAKIMPTVQAAPPPLPTKMCCVYVSLDTSARLLRKTAEDFGWSEDAFYLWPEANLPEEKAAGVWLCDRDTVRGQKAKLVDPLVRHAFETIGRWATKNPVSFLRLLGFGIGWLLQFLFGSLVTKLKQWHCNKASLSPDVLVIDSLNIMDRVSQEIYFQQFLQQRSDRLRLIVFIMDSSGGHDIREKWEYVSDIIVRLGSTAPQTPGDYFLRTIQIQKARFQDHVFGPHQLKIYGKPSDPGKPIPGGPGDLAFRERSHPFLTGSGGIFIFPSIHYYLSKFKRSSSASAANTISVYPGEMSSLFSLPKGRCAAIVGSRGTHKSRLGYMQVLKNIADGGYGLIISLRDDEAMTIKSLRKILEQEKKLQDEVMNAARLEIPEQDRTRLTEGLQGPYDRDYDDAFDRAFNNFVNNAIKKNILKILYYPPGSITPDEFFHRMFVSLQAMQHGERGRPEYDGSGASRILVLFNSLDQLSARFPMCANEKLFIPGMVQVFAGSKVSSIFISVEEPSSAVRDVDGGLSNYGLLPMADLILRIDHDTDQSDESVVITVDRNAGGEPVGRKGHLKLVLPDRQRGGNAGRAGLIFEEMGRPAPSGAGVR